MAETTGRIIGIRHRTKKTKSEEARPTQVAILGKLAENPSSPFTTYVHTYDLADEMAELDWVRGIFPIEYRTVEPEEDINHFLARHIVWRKLKKDENPDHLPQNLLLKQGKDVLLALKVPIAYDGLMSGDIVAVIMGGSGNYLTGGLAARASEVGASGSVFRIPAYRLKEKRESLGRTKDQDALTLAEMAKDQRELFYAVRPADRDLIWLEELLEARTEAMKERIACEQRMRQMMLGRVFRATGADLAGTIEEQFSKEKANDAILNAAIAEEKRREKDLISHLLKIPIYREIFEPIEGVGPLIAARLICAAKDIRLFPTKAKLKAFCGVHILEDGRFPRKRTGERANWSPEARQALFLLGDQFNRRPDSEWGQKLLQYKEHFRQVHPEVETTNGKKRFTPAHIHKMALWRARTKFVERLFREWWKIEKSHQQSQTS